MTRQAPNSTDFSEFDSSTPAIAEANAWCGFTAPRPSFENAEISAILKRAIFYARAGVSVHFRGGAGLGKTSLALAMADKLGRPVAFMAGNDWLDVEDMIGKEVGHSTSSVVDRYIQRVRRSESHLRYDWAQSILAQAMEQGQTLIYDEFTRASAKVNGILLSVLEEGVLISTDRLNDRTVLKAHPEFRIILTSNPEDYAGVNSTPDALLDRMVTFNLNAFSTETRVGIVAARTGVPTAISDRIVRLLDKLEEKQESERRMSMRAAILVARIVAMRLRAGRLSDALLAQITADVLSGRGATHSAGQILRQIAELAPLPEDAK